MISAADEPFLHLLQQRTVLALRPKDQEPGPFCSRSDAK